ncbi:hypothetical protein Moror_16571, partial [Moniliophthora roreri MCA 2997]
TSLNTTPPTTEQRRKFGVYSVDLRWIYIRMRTPLYEVFRTFFTKPSISTLNSTLLLCQAYTDRAYPFDLEDQGDVSAVPEYHNKLPRGLLNHYDSLS